MSRLGPPRPHSHSSSSSSSSSSLSRRRQSIPRVAPLPTPRYDHSIPSGTSAWDRQLRRLSVIPTWHRFSSGLWHSARITAVLRVNNTRPLSSRPIRLFLQHSSTAPTSYFALFITLKSVPPVSPTYGVLFCRLPPIPRGRKLRRPLLTDHLYLDLLISAQISVTLLSRC
ncbi:hypothetical protein CPAR01_10119 [Colletotrichum paranaense]|nr:uncharacterized protein CPAR01_10119 [Colletotrichum paranaense]KAK1533411.1 hypothetical protein CPAR01_10119 [Colletotrichum paranaense]